MKKKLAKAVTITMSGVVAATSVPTSTPIVMAQEVESGVGTEEGTGSETGDTGGMETTEPVDASLSDLGVLGNTSGSMVKSGDIYYSKDLAVSITAAGITEGVVVTGLEVFTDNEGTLIKVDGGELNEQLPSYTGTLKVKFYLENGQELVDDLVNYIPALSDVTTYVRDTDAPVFGDKVFSGNMDPIDIEGITYYQEDGQITWNLSEAGIGIDEASLKVSGIASDKVVVSGSSVVIDTTGLVDGENKVSVEIADKLGNTSSAELTVFMYRGTPSLECSEVSGDLYTNTETGISYVGSEDASIKISITGCDDIRYSQFKLLSDSGELESFSRTEDGAVKELTIPLGESNLRLQVTDVLGQTSEISISDLTNGRVGNQITVDAENPAIDESTLVNSNTVVDGENTVAIDASGYLEVAVEDAISGIQSVSVTKDGESVASTYENGKVRINLSDLSQGENVLSIEVKDNVGNTATGTIAQWVLTEVPEVTGSGITDTVEKDSRLYTNGNMEVSLSGFDAWGVASISLVGGGEEVPFTEGKATISESGTYSVKVVDIAGREKVYALQDLFEVASSEVVFDVDVPVVEMVEFDGTLRDGTDGVQYLTKDGTFKFTIRDDGVGVDWNSVKLPEGIQFNHEDGQDYFTIDSTQFSNSEDVSVAVVVADRLGNISNTYSYNFSILRETSAVEGVSHSRVVVNGNKAYTNKEVSVQIKVNRDEVTSVELIRDGIVVGTVEDTFTMDESGVYAVRVTNVLGDVTDYTLEDLFDDGSILSAIEFDTDAPVIGKVQFTGSSRESDGVVYYTTDGTVSQTLSDTGAGVDLESVRVAGLPSNSYSVSEEGFKVDTSKLLEGTTSYTVSVEDALGNVNSYEGTIVMYRSAPDVNIDSVHGEYFTDSEKGITYFDNTLNVYLNVTSPEKISHLYLVNEEGERVDIESNHFAISETGEYSIEIVDLLGDVVEYSLEDLYEGIYSDMQLDTDHPTVSSKTFDGDRETVGDRTYYTSNGTIRIEITDFGSGVAEDSWTVRGIDSEYVAIDEDGLGVSINTEGLVDGLSNISISVRDNLGNSLSDTTEVYMYRTTPDIGGNAHSSVISKDGISYTTSTVNVQITGFDSEKVTKIELLKDGTVIGEVEDGKFSIEETGNYTIQVTDLLGDIQTYRMEDLFDDGFTSEVEFDTLSPEIASRSFNGSTRVVDGKIYYTSDGTLTLGVEDEGVGISDDFYSVSGISGDAVSVEESDIMIDTSYLSEGESTIRVNIKDSLGNTREYSIELYMFRTIPEVSGGTVSGNYHTSGSNTYIADDLQFSINVSEVAKVTAVELYKDGESVSGITNNTFTIGDSGRYSVVLTDILGDKHEYALEDLYSGLVSNIVLDVDAPETIREDFSGDSITVDDQLYYISDGTYSIRVEDADSGLNSDTWNISGIDAQYISYSDDGSIVNIDTAGLVDGNRTISYTVKDNLGNTLSGSVNLFMHRSFPNIAGDRHSNVLVREGNIYIKDPMTVSLSGYDSYKVKSLELLKDGEVIEDISETGTFTISESGEYTIRVRDLIDAVRDYSLSDLFSNLADTVVLDTKAPAMSGRDFTGQETTVDGVEYYVSDGNLVLTFADADAGINRDSYKVSGVPEDALTVSENGSTVTISTADIPEGSSTIGVSVEDNLGTAFEINIPVFMFRYAPEISGVSHSDVNLKGSSSYINRSLEVVLGDWDNYKIKTIELYRNGTLADEIQDGRFAVSSPGEYTVRVVDLVNNARVYRLEDLFDDITSNVVVDTDNPEAVLTVNGEDINSESWITEDGILRVDLSDGIGLNNAVVTVNGQTFSKEFNNSISESIKIDLENDIERPENGIYRVVVSVTDTAGNTLTTDTRTIRADFDNPEFVNLGADGFLVEDEETGKVYLRGTLAVTGSTSDIGSGVERVELLNNGNVVASGLPLNILSSGNYSIRVTDRAGLSTEVLLRDIMGTDSNDLIVDNNAPTVERSSGFEGDLVSDGNIWYGSAPELVYRISDENIKSVQITVNGDVVVDSVSRDGTYRINTSEYEGNVEVHVETVDRVGNATEDTFVYKADFTAPASVRGVIDKSYLSKSGVIFFQETPSVNVSAVDSGVGIAEYRLSGSRVDANTTGQFELGTGSYSIEIVDRLGHSTGVIPIGNLLGLGSNTFIVDSAAPEISATKPESPYENWYGEDISYSITLRDNVGLDRAEVSINGQNVETYTTTETDTQETVLTVNTSDVPVSSNGMYQIQVAVVDNAGNRSDWSDIVHIDRDAPVVDRFIFTGDGSVEGVESNGSNRYGFFFNGGATCEIRVSDGDVSSGLNQLVVTLESTSGSVSTQTVDISAGVARVSIPSNFKGFVSAYAIDRVGHQGAENHPDGVVTEDANYHMNSLSLDIQLPETQYQDTAGNPLYSADMSATATIGCTMSGIRNIEWGIGGNTLGSVAVSENGTVSGDSASVTSTDRNLVLSLNKTLSMQGNANGLELWVRVTDRTGHTSETSRIFSIDKDAPQISVSYDNTEEDTYYSGTRTATITVQERNFDPGQFVVSGQSGSLGSWSNNGETWTNTITFSEDGDYQFNLSCTDRAGNESAVYSSDSFTIDKTAPVMSVSWNNDNPSNGDFFNSTRIATVTVVEHNFDPSRFILTGDGSISGWSNNGDTHVATVEFSEDGQYQFSLTGEDLAGNASDGFESGVFNIDATMPVLEVTGVENSVSYKEDVGFSISMSDANIDMSRTSVSLTGRKNGAIRVNGTLNEQTGEYEFTSFPREEMYDDIYTLTAVVVDRAGNTVEREITFSVNRFGSKYTFMDPSILGTYLSEAQDVVITESNVDRLDTNAARVVVIKDGADYPVDEQYIHIDEVEGEDGKYTYTYRIDKEAFKEDGAYLVQIYSHAVEGTDYNSLSQEYAFILDTTAPEVIVSGVESGQTYRDYERTVTIDVRDLSGVQEITAELNGENVPLNRANGVYSFTIQESAESQSLVVRVVDMAGNESVVTVEDFVLSSESTVYLMNQSWFRWGLGAVTAFLAAIIALIIKNRRAAKKDEEEFSKKYSELYKTSSGSASASGTSSTGGKDLVGDLDSTEEATTNIIEEKDGVTDLDSSSEDQNK